MSVCMCILKKFYFWNRNKNISSTNRFLWITSQLVAFKYQRNDEFRNVCSIGFVIRQKRDFTDASYARMVPFYWWIRCPKYNSQDSINLDPEKLVQKDVHSPWGSSQVSAQRGPNVRYMAGPLAVTLSCPVIISLSLGLSSLGCQPPLSQSPGSGNVLQEMGGQKKAPTLGSSTGPCLVSLWTKP